MEIVLFMVEWALLSVIFFAAIKLYGRLFAKTDTRLCQRAIRKWKQD